LRGGLLSNASAALHERTAMTQTTDVQGLVTRSSVVVVAPWILHPNCGMGGGVLCFHALQRLSQLYDIHFVSFDLSANDPEGGKQALAAFCSSVTFVPRPRVTGSRLTLWVRQLLTGIPWEVSAFKSAEMVDRLRKIIVDHKPALALVQFPYVAQYIPVLAGMPVVMDVQDACMVSRFREWRRTNGRLRRLAKMLSWMAWAAHETRYYAKASALLALSENDHGVLSSFITEVPCFLSPVAAEITAHTPSTRERYVAFVGNFSHAPNRDALKWLLDEIWPIVRARVPDAELHVAGPGLPDDFLASTPTGVRILGFVRDVGDFLDKAAVAVVPYRFGGGVKIKALDAMAHGCPVVATTIGAEGLRVERGKHLLIEDDAEGFAAAVSRVLKSRELQMSLGEAGRAHVGATFSWSAKTAGLVAVFRWVLARQTK
jgi:glycosyltransferase involved in cell wall biosynthesis